MRRKLPERRDVLARTAGLAVAGGAGALAGCIEDEARTDDGAPAEGSTDTRTPTDGAVGAFAVDDWLPAPSAVEAGVAFGFGILRPAELAPKADALGQDYYDELVAVQGLLPMLDIAPEDVTTHVAFTASSTIEASFDRDSAVTGLQDGGFEASGAHEGFDVFAPTDDATQDGVVVAVGDGVLVVGRKQGDVSARDGAAAAIDAGVGDGDRLVDARPGAKDLTDRLVAGELAIGLMREPPTETVAEHGKFAGNTGLGWTIVVDGSSTAMDLHLTFEIEDDADPDAVQEWVDEARTGSVLDILEDVTVEAEGAAVVVSGTLETDDVSETPLGGIFVEHGDEVEKNVQAGASVIADDDANKVEATWTSNQNADHLTVTFETDGGDVVEKRIDSVGDSVTYEGEDGATVTVTVTAHADDKSTVILEKQVAL